MMRDGSEALAEMNMKGKQQLIQINSRYVNTPCFSVTFHLCWKKIKLPLQNSIFQLSLKHALKQNTRHYTYLGQLFTCMIYCL